MSVKHFFSTVQADKGGDSTSQGRTTHAAKEYESSRSKQGASYHARDEDLSPNQRREKFSPTKSYTEDGRKVELREESAARQRKSEAKVEDEAVTEPEDEAVTELEPEPVLESELEGELEDGKKENDFYDLEAQNTRLKDEVLRMHADMENTKKRLNRLFEDRVKDKTIALLLDVISHIDNFERAFEAQEQMKEKSKEKELSQTELDAVFDGFRITKTQLISTLQNNWGLKAIEPLNREFDPNLHEALLQEESKTVKHPTVTQELLRGYMYLDKVIRPSKVKVVLPKKENE